MEQQLHVFDVDEAQRCFTRAKDEFFVFLKHHVGGAQEGVLTVAVGDAAEGAHGAGQDDHRIKSIGAAGEGNVHALGGVQWHALGELQAIGQFFLHDDLPVTAGDDVNLMGLGIQPVEQPLGVNGAAGAGDGHENSHRRSMTAKRRAVQAVTHGRE